MSTLDQVKSQALTQQKPKGIQELIESSAKELGKALPAHMNPERLVRIALTTLRLNPKLYQCDPMSFLGALFQSAQIGLEPNIEGQAYIIPYNSKNGLMAQFQIGYKGLAELFYRHKSSTVLRWGVVHQKDQFEFDLGEGTIVHRWSIGEDRGEPVAYWARAIINGAGIISVMSKEEALKFAQRYSKCFDRKSGKFYSDTPWSEQFDSMALKTVLKQLTKLVPKSIELQKALAADETVKRGVAADMFEVPSQPYQELVEDRKDDQPTSEGDKFDKIIEKGSK